MHTSLSSETEYTARHVGADSSVVQLLDNIGSIRYTIHLSGKYPNVHPITFKYPQITSLPVKIEKGNKIFNLIKWTNDPLFIDRVLQEIDDTNYDIWSMEDLRHEALEQTGMTWDQMKEYLLSLPRN